MQKYKIVACLLFPLVVLGCWVVFLSAKVLFMPEVKVQISGYDPRDLLSGHYIAYTINWDKTDCSQFENNQCPKDEFDAYAVNEYWGKQHRFYVSEHYADELDGLLRFNTENHVFEVVYKYRAKIKPVARQLLIDGKPWQEMISKL